MTLNTSSLDKSALTKIERVSIVGLGKLGACMAAAIASRGWDVVGVDVSQTVVEKINNGLTPIPEPGLEELIAANRRRLRATTDIADAIASTDATFIIVPTPSEESGAFSLRFATEVASGIGRALRTKESYHLVVLTSTVLPGASDATILPLIEQGAGKSAGESFGYCYSPEFIALGSVIRDFLNPDFVLIGEVDARAGDVLQSFYEALLAKTAPVARMSCTNAELTKLAVNTYLTMKISFANTIADLCQVLPGGNVDVVTKAMGLDSRIGARYLTGALGYGGPCFPRDNLALAYLARTLGLEPLLAEGTDLFNRGRATHVVDLVDQDLAAGAAVAVFGLAYKPLTDVVEESQGMYIVKELVRRGYRVRVFDPIAMNSARKELQDTVSYASSIKAALDEADALVIANPDQHFQAINSFDFRTRSRPLVILDCWRLLREEIIGKEMVCYRAVGVEAGLEADLGVEE